MHRPSSSEVPVGEAPGESGPTPPSADEPTPPGALRLTDRERAVLSRVADGETGLEIAEELYLSQATVERYVSSALRRLGAKNRAHGIALALRTGELDDAGPGGPGTGGERVDALLVQTVEGLEDAAVVLDAHGEVLVTNEAWRALARANGRSGEQAGPDVLVCGTATESPDARRAARGIRELLEDRARSFAMAYRCDGPGERRWFELRAVRYHGAGSGAAVLVCHRDVSDQRSAEQEARIGRTVVDGTDAATVVYTPSGIVTAWPAGAEAMTGCPREQAIGRPVWDLFLPRRDKARGQAVVEEALSEGGWSGEMQLERADGSTFQADVRIRRHTDADGDVTGLVGVVVDVTEREGAQRAIADVTARLQAFADAARDGWLGGDATGRITQVNAAAEAILGRRADELLGLRLDAITAAPNPLRPLTRPAGSTPGEIHRERLLAGDGREVPIHYRKTPVAASDGPDGWAIVFRRAEPA